MAGRRTSVYLSEPVAAALAASGRPLAEVIAAGLGIEPEPAEDKIRRVVREELAAALRSAPDAREGEPAQCPHPKARVHKGLCGACGRHV